MPEEIKSDPLKNLKFLHQALAGDELYKENVPQDFNEFVKIYSEPENARNLHAALAGDDYYKENVPENFEEAVKLYALPVGKPSPTPQSASGLGTQKNVGQTEMVSQEPSMPSPSSAQDLDFGFKKVIEEIENPADPNAVLRLPTESEFAQIEKKPLTKEQQVKEAVRISTPPVERFTKDITYNKGKILSTENELKKTEQELSVYKEKIDSSMAIYENESLSPQERNKAVNEYNRLIEESAPLTEKYNTLANNYNGFIADEKALFGELDKAEKMRQKGLEKEYSHSLNLIESVGRDLLKTVSGITKMGSTMNSVIPNFGLITPEEEKVAKESLNNGLSELNAFAEKLISQETPENYKKLFEGDFSLGKLAYVTTNAISSTVPTVAAGLLTGPIGAMTAGAGLGFEESKAIMQDAGLNDTESDWAALGLAIPIGLLEKYGADDVVKLLNGSGLRREVASELAKKIAGKSLTKDAIFLEAKKTFGEVIKSKTTKLLKEGGKESFTEMAQGELQEGVKQIVQEFTGVDKDENMSTEDYLKQQLMQRAEEGVGGFLGGSSMQGGGMVLNSALNKKEFSPSAYTKAMEFADPAKYEQFKQDLLNEVENGVLTEDQANEAIANVNAIQETNALIPNSIKDLDLRTDAVNLIIEKNNLTKEISEKDPDLTIAENERLAEIKKSLNDISLGKKPNVFSDEILAAAKPKVEEIQVLEMPTSEQQFNEAKEGNTVTFTYTSEAEVPDVFKDKISSKGEINGKPSVKVTVAKSLADFYLQSEGKPTETAQPKVTVEEIKSLPLTRIEGAGMGSNQAVGTFISTEPENRYAAQFPDKEVQSMEVDIENPFVSEDTNLIDFRNELANRRKVELDETDFTEVEIPDGNFTVDDLSDSGIEKVAGMVTEELKAKGYDSIYFPKTETQEGELVVFDRGKARKKGEAATKTVDQLRADEQAEIAQAIPNMAEYPDTYGENQGNMPDDLYAVYKPIYDKYDALITPKLESEKAATTTEQAPTTQTPPAPAKSKLDILLSGLREGWVAESYYAFDPREFRDLMFLINAQRSFAKIVEKNGKKYVVVGLSLAPQSMRDARSSGRDNFSFAAVELNENTPSNIVETLENSARENFKNIYRDFSSNDSVSPIKEVDAELNNLTQTPTQNATQTREIQPSNQQQREVIAQQQQGQQENRANQEGNVAQSQAEAGGGNRVAEGGAQQEATPEQQGIAGTYGNEGEVKFADGVIMNHKFKLIEADDMQPSHLVSGQRNPKHLIALAQPKERNDQGSRIQQDKIADNPRLQEVGDSPIAYTGAPIVNKRGEVIQGNNRSLGLKKHYEIGGKSYKEQLAENAEKFGLTKGQVMAMKNPVLVREVSVSDQAAIVLGNYDVKDIETGGKQRIDPIVTSRKIKPSDRQKLTTLVFDGDKTVKEAIRDSAREIATIVKSYINPAQMKTAFSLSGEITASGMDDIEGIMNSFLYEDGPASLPEVFSSLPNVVQKGVQKGIPSLVSVNPEKSLLKDVQNAMTAVYEYIQSAADNFDVWSRSVDMFLGVSPQELFSPLELDLANKMLNAKKQSDIANIFKQYQANVTDQPAGLFDEAVPGLSKKDAISKQFNLEYDETNDIKGEGQERVAPALRAEGQPVEPIAENEQDQGGAEEFPTEEQRDEIEEDGFPMPTDEEMAAKSEEIQTDLQKAIQDVKDKFGDLFNQNMGIIYDPKVEARKLYNFHVALVNLAKTAIRSGINTADQFARNIGKRLDKFTERAFNDAMNYLNGDPMIINSEQDMLNAEYQRVAESYAKQREDAKKLKKPFLKRFIEGVNAGWLDANYVAKKLLSDVGGFEAIKFKNLLGGASSKAKTKFETLKREIFGGLTSAEKKLLNDIIQARTVISIDNRYDAKGKSRIKHPGDTNKESQAIFLGQIEESQPKLFNKLIDRSNKYFEAQRELLDERLKEGRISVEQYQGMVDNDYSPRVFLEYLLDDTESGSGLTSGGQGSVGRSDIKSLSDGDVNSLFHNAEWLLASNVLSTSRSIFHNRANRSLYELAKADPNNGFIEIQTPNGFNKETGQPTYKDPRSDQRQVQFFENGVRKSMLVTREFGESWNNNNPLLAPQYANAIRIVSGGVIKRLFATGINPLFALSNFPRDIAHSLFFTNAYSPNFPVALAQISTDLVRTAKDAWKFNRTKDKNGRYYKYIMQGGGMDFLSTQGLPFEQQALLQSSAKEAMDAVGKVLGYINNSSEIWVRLAIREREAKKLTAKFARDNGRMPNASEKESIESSATDVSRSQMDFSQGGRWAKAMDNLIPYLNASLQGLRVSVRYARKNPKVFSYKVAQALAISAALAAYNMRFKDDYDDIEDEEKNRNFIIMLDFFKIIDGKKCRMYLRIPKNQSSQWIFAIGEIMGESMESKEFRPRKGASTLQTLMPPYDPRNIPLIDALNTYETGYDRFREKYVYDKDYKGEAWAEYYENKTPWLWRDIGKQFGLSPIKLKAAVGKLTADPDNNIIWIGVTEGYDKLIKSVPEDEQKSVNDMALESIEQLLTPVQRKFLAYTNPDSKAKSIRELEASEATKVKLQNDTVKNYVKKYINDELTETEARSEFSEWLNTQPKDSVNTKRLKTRFENSIQFKDVDNVFYRMGQTDYPKVKARLLFDAYINAKDKDAREVLLFQAKSNPNVPKDKSSEFWKEFERLEALGKE